MFLTKEMEDELREYRINKDAEEHNEPPKVVKFELPSPDYTILFPDSKKSLGDEYLRKWRLEKAGVEVK